MVERKDDTPEAVCPVKHDMIVHRLNLQDMFLLETFANNYKSFVLKNGSTWPCCADKVDTSTWPLLDQLTKRHLKDDREEISGQQKATPTPVIQHTKMQNTGENSLEVGDLAITKEIEEVRLDTDDDESMGTCVNQTSNDPIIPEYSSPNVFSFPPCDNIEDSRLNSKCCERLEINSPSSNIVNEADVPHTEPNDLHAFLQSNKNQNPEATNDNCIRHSLRSSAQIENTNRSDTILQQNIGCQNVQLGQSEEVRVSNYVQEINSSAQVMNHDFSNSEAQKDCQEDLMVIELSSDEEQGSIPSCTQDKAASLVKVSVRHSISNKSKLLGMPFSNKAQQKRTLLNRNNSTPLLSSKSQRINTRYQNFLAVTMDARNKSSERCTNTSFKNISNNNGESRIEPIRIIKVNNQYSTSPPSSSSEIEKPANVRQSPSAGETTSTSSLSETETGEYDNEITKQDAVNYYMPFVPEVILANSQENSQAIQADESINLETDQNSTENRNETLTKAVEDSVMQSCGPSIIISVGSHTSKRIPEQVETASNENYSYTSPNGSCPTTMEFSPSSDGQESVEIIELDEGSTEMNENERPVENQPPPLLLRSKASLKCMGTTAQMVDSYASVMSSGFSSIDRLQDWSQNPSQPPLLSIIVNDCAEKDSMHGLFETDDSNMNTSYCYNSPSDEEPQEEEIVLLEEAECGATIAVQDSPLVENTVHVEQEDHLPLDADSVQQNDNVIEVEAPEEPRLLELLIPPRSCTKQVSYNEPDERTKGESMRKSKRRRKRSTRMKGFLTKNKGKDDTDSEDENVSSSLNTEPPTSNHSLKERPEKTTEQPRKEINPTRKAANWRSVESTEQVQRRRPGRPRARDQRSSKSETFKKAKSLTDVEDTVPLQSWDGAKTDWNASDDEPLIKKKESRRINPSEHHQSDTKPRKISLRNMASRKVYTEVNSSSSDEERPHRRRLTKKPKRDIPKTQSPVAGPTSTYPTVPYRRPAPEIITNENNLITEEELNDMVSISSDVRDCASRQSNDSASVSAAPTVVLSEDDEDPDATCIVELPSSLDSQASTTTTSTPNNETRQYRCPRATCHRCGKSVAQNYLQKHYESKYCKRRQESGAATGAEDSQTETEAEDCITNNEGVTPPKKLKVSCEFCGKPLRPKSITSHIEKSCKKLKNGKVEQVRQQTDDFLSQPENEENSQAEEESESKKPVKTDFAECEKRVKKLKKKCRHKDVYGGRKGNDRDKTENRCGNDDPFKRLPFDANGSKSYFNGITDELSIGSGTSIGVEKEREVRVQGNSGEPQEDVLSHWFCAFEDCLFEPENHREYEKHLMDHPPNEGVQCEHEGCTKVFFCKLNMQNHLKGHVKTYHHDATYISVKNNSFYQPNVKIMKLK